MVYVFDEIRGMPYNRTLNTYKAIGQAIEDLKERTGTQFILSPKGIWVNYKNQWPLSGPEFSQEMLKKIKDSTLEVYINSDGYLVPVIEYTRDISLLLPPCERIIAAQIGFSPNFGREPVDSSIRVEPNGSIFVYDEKDLDKQPLRVVIDRLARELFGYRWS